MGLGLGLSIGVGDEYVPKRDLQKNKRVAKVCLDLSLPLCSDDEPKEAINSEYSKVDGAISSSETCKFEDCTDDIENKNCSNKKLRLTAQQTSLLEDSFNMSNTLNKVIMVYVCNCVYIYDVCSHYNTWIDIIIII